VLIPEKSYAASTAFDSKVLIEVIAASNTAAASGIFAKYSKTGMPKTWSRAGSPVRTL
jgi:hypothetical protein